MSIKGLFKINKLQFICTFLIVAISSALLAGNNALLTLMGDSLRKGNLLVFVAIIGINFLADIIGSAMQYVSMYLYDKQIQSYDHEIRKKYIKFYYNQPGHEVKVADIENSLMQELNMLNETYLIPWLKIFACGLDVLLSSIIVFVYNWILLVVIAFLAILMFVVPSFLSSSLQEATDNISTQNAKYLDVVGKWFGGLSILQRYHAKEKLLSVILGQGHQLETANVKRSKQLNTISGINDSFNSFSQVLLLLVTGVLIINGKLNFGVFFSIGNFASVIFSELVAIVNRYTTFKSSKSLNDKVKQKLAKQTLSQDSAATSLSNFGSLEVNNLSIVFNNQEQIAYPDFTIKRGEKVLLTGDSGTGKSTLLKLILHELTPSTGEIVFKDRDNQSITKPDLSNVGYIPQDPILFPVSIKENITMFDSKLDERVPFFIERVNLSDDIAKFADGIDTVVDYDKHALSGGQRQKVVLARAQIHDSQLIFIDEGTSAIDASNTLAILKNLLKSDATIVFIAHNLTDEMSDLFDREIHLSKSNQ